MNDNASPTNDQGATGLKKNALGLVGATIIGVVIMSPSMAIIANVGPIAAQLTGGATSLVFLVALLIILPTAYSYAHLSNRIPTAGSAYKWASQLISPKIGIAIGFCCALYYALIFATLPPLIGQVGLDLFSTTSPLVFALVLFGSIVVVAPLIFRGVSVSLEAAVVLVVIEVTIMMVASVAGLISSPEGHLSLAPLDPSGIGSLSIMASVLILAVLAFTGFDAVSTVAEETRMPKSVVPKGTLFSALAVGLLWVLTSFLISNSFSPDTLGRVVENGGVPLSHSAQTAFGSAGRIVIDLMALEAGLGVLIGSAIGASRLLYSMSRDGILPQRLGWLHPRFEVPWVSLATVLGLAVFLNVAVALYVGLSLNIFIWLANVTVLFLLITFISVNASNIAIGIRENEHGFHWLRNGVVPVFGIIVLGYFLYRAFFKSLWGLGFEMGRSCVIVGLLAFAVALIAGYVLARTRGDLAGDNAVGVTEVDSREEVAAP